jgi:hypothetical protein
VSSYQGAVALLVWVASAAYGNLSAPPLIAADLTTTHKAKLRVIRTAFSSSRNFRAPISALCTCALHVFPDSERAIGALDIQPNVPPEESLAQAQAPLRQADWPNALILTDVSGATSQRGAEAERWRARSGSSPA